MKRIKKLFSSGMEWVNRSIVNRALLLMILFAGFQTAKEIVGTGFTLNGKRVTGIKDDLSDQSINNLVTQFAVKQALSALELSSGTNVGEVYNVRNYGAVPTAVIPASGSFVTGASQHAAFQAAINAAPEGAMVFVGAGDWVVTTTLAEITTKRLYLVVLGRIFTNGVDFLKFGSPNAFDKRHFVLILGSLIARVNIPTNNPTTRAAGTSPPWQTFTGVGITIGINVNNMILQLNEVSGYRVGVEILGGNNGGSQENTVAFMRMNNNAVAFRLRSTTGVGWCDKNHFVGWNGGIGRVSGGLAVEIDGYQPASGPNSENWNGAFTSDLFRFLVERVDSIFKWNGDIREPQVDVTYEGGVNTGFFSQTPIQILSTGPNVTRGMRMTGTGILGVEYLNNGVGVDGVIEMPLYQAQFRLICNKARIGPDGLIYAQVPENMSKSIRDGLPSNFRCVNTVGEFTHIDITSAYTRTTGMDLIRSNGSNVPVNLGAPSSAVDQWVWVRNFNASNVTVTATPSSAFQGTAIVGQNATIGYYSDGITWTSMNNTGGGGGGSSPWIDNGTYINYLNSAVIGFSGTPKGKLHIVPGNAATNDAPIYVEPDTLQSVAQNNTVEYDATSWFVTYNNTRRKLLDESNFAVIINKIYQGEPIVPYYINGSAGQPGDVMTTDGTTNGSHWQRNLGGMIRVSDITNSAVPVTLATVDIPNTTGGEIEVILRGRSGTSLWKEHWLQSYVKVSGTLTLKGAKGTLGAAISDFSPAGAFGGIVSSNNYLIRISSPVTLENIEWTVDYIVRPTENIE